MKNLIFVNGTMGAGKTAVCRALQSRLEPCVLLDGDECAEMLLSPDGIPEEELEPESIDFEPYGG